MIYVLMHSGYENVRPVAAFSDRETANIASQLYSSQGMYIVPVELDPGAYHISQGNICYLVTVKGNNFSVRMVDPVDPSVEVGVSEANIFTYAYNEYLAKKQAMNVIEDLKKNGKWVSGD